MFDLEYYNNITDFGKFFNDFTTNKKLDWKIQKDNHISKKDKHLINHTKHQGEVDAILNWGHIIGMRYIEWYLETIKVSKKYNKNWRLLRYGEVDKNKQEIGARASKLKVHHILKQ